MSRTQSRAIASIRASVTAGPRTSPAITIRLVVVSVSTATRDIESPARNSSTMASEMRSHTLSGWPSETDSLVNR